ncbi:MAG: DUF979 domain-containing protein [Opitutaceae bacterium]|nr:DUF979 domain-containing protein [Opitutaceae bacterium]
MKILSVEVFYVIAGVFLALVAARTAWDRAHPKRWGTASFWALLAVIFVFGKILPPAIVGYLVLAMVVLAAAKQVARSSETSSTRAERTAEAGRLQNRLFWPALLIPATAIAGSLVLDRIHVGDVWLMEPRHASLISLGLGALVAVAFARRTTGARVSEPVQEGGRLLQTIGWALILPQMLAALGGIFAQAGVGVVVADLVGRALPTQFPFVAVAAYCLGMALFTICMGNAFAAFAVITGGIGLPLIVVRHGGNPAIMAAVGMLSGYCGTLLTPMAANFNLVPAMLLELRDRNAVIKAQAPMAVAIWIFNVALMYVCVYRF